MDDLSQKSVLVLDQGVCPHVATRLAEKFGEVFYYVPWVSFDLPSEKRRQVGTGIPNITRVDQMWSVAREVDLIVVCHLYFYDEVEQLRQMGKPVWAAGYAEALELDRLGAKRLMEKDGIPVSPYKVCEGEDELRAYLQTNNDCYIKASLTRGDWETMHWEGEHLSGPELDENIRSLGPSAKEKIFVVEKPLAGCEVGYDGYCIQGRYGRKAMWGYEGKDAGYVGTICDFDLMPDKVREPTLQIGKLIGRAGGQGFFSNEIRIDDEGTPYPIDLTMRAGNPPSESYMEAFSNWPEVVWAGAHGDVVDLIPEEDVRYAVQIVLKSDWLLKGNYLPVYFPPNISRWVKLHNYCIVGGDYTVCPQDYLEFGSVIGLGPTKKDAEDAALEHAEQVEALKLQWKEDVFDALDKCIAEGRKVGVDFPED